MNGAPYNMIIGIPKEIKSDEYRVGATPAMVRALVEAGHTVYVQKDAGSRLGYTDQLYQSAGAQIASTAPEIYKCEMVIKVKEPQENEYPLLKKGQILFCYLHLAPDPKQTQALLDQEVVGIAYETVTNREGKLPLLTPMSEIAGRLAIQVGAACLQNNHGGRGLLLGGVPGVLPTNVLIIGGGVVGTEAARMAMGLGANVTVVDKSLDRLHVLDMHFGPNLKTLYSSTAEIEPLLHQADLVIGAVLIPGKQAPKLISKSMLKKMTPGTVIIDVAIDQGGCTETSRPTTHSSPTYTEEGIIHYCVTNMPGVCARTATMALTHATTDYALKIANRGWERAVNEDEGIRNGLNVCYGHVTNEMVAHDLGYPFAAKYSV